ncbi:hypothetical protein [uncultured Paracoccus sp.]|uniref:hypothetical protein n=1 Tax=uncultured Paracoccus sp. TaxID=189685 RepID=UPI0025D51DE0|nr:hypothetical protein [uncultured Paracoccus sp.]
MGDCLTAVVFDRPPGRRGRMTAQQDGQPVPRPFVAAELDLRAGGVRHVLFLPQDIDTMLLRHLVLRLGDMPIAEIDPAWLQLPRDDLPALTAQLSPRAIARLLRVMLTTGASLFAGRAQAGLAHAVPRLMDICAIPAVAPVARTDIAGRILASYPVPGLSGLPEAAVLIRDGRLDPIRDFDCFRDKTLLHVLLPAGSAPDQIVALADMPLRLAAPDAAPRLSAPAWIQGRAKPCRDWLFTCLGASAAALEQELAGNLADPVITVRHLSASAAGLLHLLLLQDPARVVRKVILDWGGHAAELTPLHGPDGTALLAGLADLPGGARGGACRIRVLQQSGRLRTLAEAPVAPHDGSIPVGFADAWAAGVPVLEPLARSRAALRRVAPPSAAQHFGPEQRCGLRIVTAIGSSADLIRARAALILAEAHPTPVEVVCTLADGPLVQAARHALAQTAAIYGIAHRLVLLPGSATDGECLAAALTQAWDVPALVLGGDVLPQDPGWLGFWLRRLRRQEVMAPALLAADGSIAATCAGRDPLRGLPAAHLPAAGRPAPRPLAACLALGPAGIARLLDAPPHPDAAVWIAGAFAGAARSEARFPFRRFGPEPAPDAFAAALAEAEFALIGKDRG